MLSKTKALEEIRFANQQNKTANLRGANLRGAYLRGANLRGTNLRGADLRGTNLIEADLEGADLRGANLGGADFRGANLGGANLGGTNLIEVNFRGAYLGGADLREANLRGANLRGTNLRGADLRGTNLIEADLEGANLREADLRGANLSNANGVLSPQKFFRQFEKDKLGVIVYKRIGMAEFSTPGYWTIEPGEFLTETCNPLPISGCGCGVNFGTIEWCKIHYTSVNLWKCRIRWIDLLGVIVPYDTDGKARCNRLELLEIVKKGE